MLMSQNITTICHDTRKYFGQTLQFHHTQSTKESRVEVISIKELNCLGNISHYSLRLLSKCGQVWVGCEIK